VGGVEIGWKGGLLGLELGFLFGQEGGMGLELGFLFDQMSGACIWRVKAMIVCFGWGWGSVVGGDFVRRGVVRWGIGKMFLTN
jgi:hypothetical protein